MRRGARGAVLGHWPGGVGAGGLGPLAGGAGEVPPPARVEQAGGKPGLEASGQERALVAAAGLEGEEVATGRGPSEQGGVAGWCVVEAEGLAGGGIEAIEARLADVDGQDRPSGRGCVGHPHSPSLHVRGWHPVQLFGLIRKPPGEPSLATEHDLPTADRSPGRTAGWGHAPSRRRSNFYTSGKTQAPESHIVSANCASLAVFRVWLRVSPGIHSAIRMPWAGSRSKT